MATATFLIEVLKTTDHFINLWKTAFKAIEGPLEWQWIDFLMQRGSVKMLKLLIYRNSPKINLGYGW